MVWFLVDDVLPFHERVLRAGNAAMGLWVRAGAWSSGQLTDGRIPADVARTLGSAAEIRRLVDVGLWEPAEDGYRFHAWAEDGTGQKRQPTKAEVEEKRRKERERKAAYRSRHDAHAPHPGSPTGVPQGVPAGQTVDVRPESREASAIPDQTKPYQARTTEIDRPSGRSISADAAAPAARSTELAIVPGHGEEAPKPAGYGQAFSAFWAAYPRHEGKRTAAAAFERAVRRADGAQAIIDGARRYAADPNRDAAFTAHPTTWLNRDGWEDAPLPARGPQSKPDRIAAAAGRMMQELGASAPMRGAR